MIIERAQELRMQIETLAQTLDDGEAVKVVEFFPSWKGNTLYNIGDRVRYNDTLYKCLTMHMSQASWNPEDAVSLWTEVLIPDPEVIPDWIQPESTNPYMTGDKVRHLNKVWISTIDYNVYEPSVYGWNEVI